MKTTSILSLIVVALLVCCIIHYFGAHLGRASLWIENINPHFISENSWHQAVSSTDNDQVVRAYKVLQKRGSTIAIADAIEDLESTNTYRWVIAAYYLASHKRQEAVPYLIKALRHTVTSSDTQTIVLLEKLTNENYGKDFTQWRRWYLIQKNAIAIDWDSYLGKNPRTNSDDPSPSHSSEQEREIEHASSLN